MVTISYWASSVIQAPALTRGCRSLVSNVPVRNSAAGCSRRNARAPARVILVSLQGLSHGEVAIVQNVSEGTIAWRMHEARRRMYEAMAPEKLQRKRELSAELKRLLSEHGLFVPVLPKGRA